VSQIFQRYRIKILSLAIVIAILLLGVGWHQYQRHAAINYLTKLQCPSFSDTVNGPASVPCYNSQSATIQSFLLDLGVHYSYDIGNVPVGCGTVSSGNIISIPGKSFIFDKKSVVPTVAGNYCDITG